MTLKYLQRPDWSSFKIEGKLVELRPINLSYAQEIYDEFSSAVTTYMVPSAPKMIEETQVFIRHSMEEMHAGTDVVCVVLDLATKEFLGCCGLHGKRNPKGPEFGIWLKQSAQGGGYGKDAIRTLGEWAERNLKLDLFVYPVDRANVPSRKLAESFGGEIIDERPTRRMNGDWLDTIFYQIPRAAFEAN
jgi:Acetyltransferases, including N-acetylases of ribosomal proteins